MIFSSEGRIATDIRASPSLAPLVGDMNARGSRRLRVGVDEAAIASSPEHRLARAASDGLSIIDKFAIDEQI